MTPENFQVIGYGKGTKRFTKYSVSKTERITLREREKEKERRECVCVLVDGGERA